jgi:Na+/H+ antiporter NhaD/arsenite permease-like protein
MTMLVVGCFVVAYLLIATERVHRVAAALAGAAAMVVLGVVDADSAFFSHESGIDWNVIFLLFGMMVIVSVVRVTGLFDFLAIWVAKRVRGRAFPLMALLVVITAAASALLDNVTTVLLIIPITFVICDRLALAPVPFVIAETMASNIGGMATLVGDPPNIIIGSRGGLSFNDFLVHLGPLTVLLLVVYLGLCRVLFGRAMTHDEHRVKALMLLDERSMITNRRLLVQSLTVLGAVMAAFVAHPVLHLAPSLVALLGAGALVAVSGLEPWEYLGEVEWPTLIFFMGLFVMVGGLVEVGIIDTLGSQAAEAVGDRFALAGSMLLFGSAVVSGVVDNIPYVATMAPVVSDLVAADQSNPQATSLWWALAAGADLGGNATAVGAGANVVAIGMAARNGHPISFWTFTKYGIVVTAVTVAIAWIYFWFTHFTV